MRTAFNFSCYCGGWEGLEVNTPTSCRGDDFLAGAPESEKGVTGRSKVRD